MADENDGARLVEDVDAQVQQIPTEPMNVDEAVQEPFWPSNAAMCRTFVALIVMVILSDLTIYHGEGFAGIAVFMVLAPVVLFAARPWTRANQATFVCGFFLVCLAGRLAWCGSDLAVICGAGVFLAFSISLNGQQPFVAQTLGLLGLAIPYGVEVLGYFSIGPRSVVTQEPSVRKAGLLSIIVPLLALGAFGLIFVSANPDLLNFISESIKPWINSFWNWLTTFHYTEILFWCGTLLLAAGLLHPLLPIRDDHDLATDVTKQPAESTLYAICRNTLVTLIGLFVLYLVFEFRTLWFREFPKGFYYAGYAHQGAAWLTAALALSTLILSLMFRGAMLNDPREPRLRKLAWIWSALNLLLAASVYNRLLIYIDFNGMTRMRTVGLFGTTSVVAGFLLTLWKIRAGKRFLWLVRRDLWAVAMTVIVYAITPVDWLIHTYNVRQIMAGDLAPVVQITEHPVSSEGLLTLEPLLECEDPIIRKGIAAMLTLEEQTQDSARAGALRQVKARRWTARQLATDVMNEHLKRSADRRNALIGSEDDPSRLLDEFRAYAFQWY